ncbi:nitroreductase family protein [Paraclostridium bifermentans]|uniref:nitroreductase family protein n=1 Tax=Paraclostridium bifermentans TaxID=1490 RepID=UPI001C7EB1E8|nr:nitroreductase family protein [Paraclostridium bifermentans]UOW69024.1 nitroreductase family protein [Paraclostridium bifermentans]GIM32667.1 nitroreductase [Paraclostridium bifermentans subsp. muricolitidis]
MKRLDFIYDRVSIRSYKEEEVPKEDIIEIIKAGTYAPSGKNLQNWHFVVVTDKEKVKAIANIVEKKGVSLSESIQDNEARDSFRKMLPYYTVFKNAPILILVYGSDYPNGEYNVLNLVGASKEEKKKALFSDPGIQNIGAAMENILLAASALGYGTCWMAGPNFAREEIKSCIGFEKEGFELVCMTPLGVPSDKKHPRPKRKPIEEVLSFID